MIRWTYAFIDRPAVVSAAATAFWPRATGMTLSAPRGDQGQFVTLLPADGDAFLKAQAVCDGGGAHVDLAADDPAALVDRAVGLGATVLARYDDCTVLASPAGLACCVVDWQGEQVRPAPVDGVQLGQVCLDVAADAYGSEIGFWAELTGWAARPAMLAGFHVLTPPDPVPFRLLLQRLDEPRAANAHLDLFCADVPATAARHEELGATVVARVEHWTVMRDPAGGEYCLINRGP